MRSRSQAGLVLLSVIAAAGCQDSNARRRAEVQRLIEGAAASIRLASSQAGDPARQADAAKALNRAVQDLGRASDGEPGQRAAAAQLAASAYMQLGALAITRAADLELQQRARRALAGALADAVADLDSMAAQLEALSVEAPLQELDRARGDSTQALSIFSGKLAELDGPIEQINKQNLADRAEADRLRSEAARFRALAAEAGPVEGFDHYEEAIRHERSADRIEFAIAERQVDLRYNLESEHALAETSVESVQERIKTIDDAAASLEELAALADDEAGKTRAQAESSRARLQAALGELSRTAEELSGVYAEAAGHLGRAATAARSAAGPAGDAGDAPRLAAAKAFQELAALQLARAQGLADQAALVGQVRETAQQASALRAEAQQAVEEAKSAFGEARGVLEQVKGRGAQKDLEALRAAIAATEAAASEPVIEPPKANAAPQAPGTAERTAQGADSPDALLGALRASVDAESAARLTLDMTLMDESTPGGRALAKAITDLARAQIALEQALKEKFGTGMMDLAAQGGMPGMQASALGGLGAGASYGLGEVSGERGAIEVSAGGTTTEIAIVRSGGRWFIDGTAVLGAMIPPGAGDQFARLMQGLSPVMEQVAGRIAAGEFASAQDAMTVLGQAMVMAMQGGPAGAPPRTGK